MERKASAQQAFVLSKKWRTVSTSNVEAVRHFPFLLSTAILLYSLVPLQFHHKNSTCLMHA